VPTNSASDGAADAPLEGSADADACPEAPGDVAGELAAGACVAVHEAMIKLAQASAITC
jgi:hypothetical protein